MSNRALIARASKLVEDFNKSQNHDGPPYQKLAAMANYGDLALSLLPTFIDVLEAMEWQPIENAPKNGSPALIHFSEFDLTMSCQWVPDQKGFNWKIVGEEGRWHHSNATYYQPNPAPPQKAE